VIASDRTGRLHPRTNSRRQEATNLCEGTGAERHFRGREGQPAGADARMLPPSTLVQFATRSMGPRNEHRRGLQVRPAGCPRRLSRCSVRCSCPAAQESSL